MHRQYFTQSYTVKKNNNMTIIPTIEHTKKPASRYEK